MLRCSPFAAKRENHCLEIVHLLGKGGVLTAKRGTDAILAT